MWAGVGLVNSPSYDAPNHGFAAEDQWICTIFQVRPVRRRTTVSAVIRSRALPLYFPVVRPSLAIQASTPSELPARRVTSEGTACEKAASAAR